LSPAGTDAAFSSSATIWFLSLAESVGACRMADSLGSLWKMVDSEEMDLAVWSSVEDFAAAVYCSDKRKALVYESMGTKRDLLSW
jgi:hypothetical protein